MGSFFSFSLAILSLIAAAGTLIAIPVATAEAPLSSVDPVALFTPVGSPLGSQAGSDAKPEPHPLPVPLLGAGPHPNDLPEPPKPKPAAGSSSSSSGSVSESSSSSPASSPAAEATAEGAEVSASPPVVYEDSRSRTTAATSPPPLTTPPSPTLPTTSAPPPITIPAPAAAAPPPPSSSSHSQRVVIKGRVSCIRCSKHLDVYSKRSGIRGVTVELECPESSINVTSSHHGQFKIALRQVPAGFPDSCTIFVVNSSLPESCNVTLVNQPSVPSLQEGSSTTASTYTVPVFEFSPTNCS